MLHAAIAPRSLTPTRLISKQFENLASALATSSPCLFRITSCAEVRIPATRVQRRILESRHRSFLQLSTNPGLQIPAFVEAAKYADHARVASCRCLGPASTYFPCHIKIFLYLRLLRGRLGASAASRASRCYFRGLGSDMHFSFQLQARRSVSSAYMTARNIIDLRLSFNPYSCRSNLTRKQFMKISQFDPPIPAG